MASNPLSPSNLLQLIEASIKPSAQQSSSSPTAQPHTLRNPYDAIALFIHACMLAVGFRLIGLDEDSKLDSPIDGSSNLKPLPPNWNASSSYSFRYAHSQSSLEFLIKVNRLGSKAVIFGLGVGDDKTANFDIAVKDFTSESFFPYTPGDDEGEEESGGQRRKLRDAFISESRISDLASLVKINIIQKLIPGLNKPGYEEDTSRAAQSSTQQQQSQSQPPQEEDPRIRFPPPHPYYPGHVGPPIPSGERPPGFDDDYEILQPPRGRGDFYAGPSPPGRNPLSIGEDDLNPPGLGGPNIPIRGPFFGEGGLPRPGLGGRPMGGMHPTPDHPMFGGDFGNDNRDPRFPPGSRYDPVGPGDAPRGGLRGPHGPGWGGGGFGGFGGGDFI